MVAYATVKGVDATGGLRYSLTAEQIALPITPTAATIAASLMLPVVTRKADTAPLTPRTKFPK